MGLTRACIFLHMENPHYITLLVKNAIGTAAEIMLDICSWAKQKNIIFLDSKILDHRHLSYMYIFHKLINCYRYLASFGRIFLSK